MSEVRRKVMGDVSWFQIGGSVLASVTAAFAASRLGVAGTLIGTALVSLVITVGSSFFTNTLKQSHTLLVRTESGTVVEHEVERDDVGEAIEDVRDSGRTVTGAEFVDDEKPRLRWKSIVATTVIVIALALAVITAIELTTGHPVGQSKSDGGISIIKPFKGGGNSNNDKPKDEKPAPNGTDETPSAPTTTAPPASTPPPSEPPAATEPAPTEAPTPTSPTDEPQ